MTEHDIEYDDALNAAGWAMVEALGSMNIEVSGKLFNNMKIALRPAIAAYLTTKEADNAHD